jgi:hypothetical protein
MAFSISIIFQNPSSFSLHEAAMLRKLERMLRRPGPFPQGYSPYRCELKKGHGDSKANVTKAQQVNKQCVSISQGIGGGEIFTIICIFSWPLLGGPEIWCLQKESRKTMLTHWVGTSWTPPTPSSVMEEVKPP